MADFVELHKQGKVLEVFSSWTAAVVIPIKEISYKWQTYTFLKDNEIIWSLTKRFLDTLDSIYYGRVKHRFQRRIL